jgi:hypothetical protein
VYAYPALADDLKTLITLENLPIPSGIEFLVKFLVENHFIVSVNNYNKEILSIIPRDIFQMIQSGTSGWERFLPNVLAAKIKEKSLFGYRNTRL